MKTYILLSPAKINLWLKITGKREDGYHTLNSLIQKIALYDTIKISEHTDEDIVRFYNAKINSSNNTVTKAIKIFKELTNNKKFFYVEIYKSIPVEAGLGGGSSNAGVILSFLNKYFDNPLTFNELTTIGSSIGADVPIFISEKKRILMEGIGEILSFPLFNIDNYWVLLIKPDFSVSTSWAYKKLNFKLTNKFKSINKRHPEHSDFVNDLEKPVIEVHPDIEKIKDTLLSLNAAKSLMSGSGSVVFGLFENKENADRADSFFKKSFKSYKTYLTKFLS